MAVRIGNTCTGLDYDLKSGINIGAGSMHPDLGMAYFIATAD